MFIAAKEGRLYLVFILVMLLLYGLAICSAADTPTDYTENIQKVEQNIEEQNKTLFEKDFNDYSVTESLLFIIVVFIFGFVIFKILNFVF